MFNDEIKEVFVDRWRESQGVAQLLSGCLTTISPFVTCVVSVMTVMSGDVWCSFQVQSYCSTSSTVLPLCFSQAEFSRCLCIQDYSTESCEIARFFQLLEKAIDKVDPTPRAMKLKDVCRTRWVERIEAYATFLELLVPLQLSLEAMVHPTLHSDLGMDWSWDGETIT